MTRASWFRLALLAALWSASASSTRADALPERSAPRIADDDEDPDGATPDPAPPVPDVLERAPRAEKIAVVEQAGVGGPLAYASATVLEVGGSGSLSAAGNRIYMRMAPFVAWFVLDGLRLSYTHELYVAKADKDYRLASAALLGGSVHFRLTDRLLIATGPELGALYNGADWGVILRPKVTLDILVGRSAILHPGLFVAWSSVDMIDAAGSDLPKERLSFGFDIMYAAMF